MNIVKNYLTINQNGKIDSSINLSKTRIDLKIYDLKNLIHRNSIHYSFIKPERYQKYKLRGLTFEKVEFIPLDILEHAYIYDCYTQSFGKRYFI